MKSYNLYKGCLCKEIALRTIFICFFLVLFSNLAFCQEPASDIDITEYGIKGYSESVTIFPPREKEILRKFLKKELVDQEPEEQELKKDIVEVFVAGQKFDSINIYRDQKLKTETFEDLADNESVESMIEETRNLHKEISEYENDLSQDAESSKKRDIFIVDPKKLKTIIIEK
ncbi:MAG: hypothetical protein P9X22_04540 [Candidatus Zapsychrus exili]|nr:hypothetical protein [Candidatus Zapsychrus exili]